jgi:8-oxo-dGTP pyrophosphatase MutT (NUDIX family)
VFPGGRVDDCDNAPSGFDEALSPALAAQLAQDRPGRDPLAFPRAALRETFEETGLLIAEPSSPTALSSQLQGASRPERGDVWRAFAAKGIRPPFAHLEYVCRAITPTSSHRRYNTRFFLARGALAVGEIKGDGELDDLGWWPLAAIPRLNLVDVTAFVLEEALRLWREGRPRDGAFPPLACYRNEIFRVRRREAPA